MAQLVRIFCKENDKLRVSVRGNSLVLVNADPNNKSQQWRKDYSVCGQLKDNQGQRAFALVNEATGQILLVKNLPASHDDKAQVHLASYSDKEGVTTSMLWTESKELAGGFREVRAFRDVTKTLNGIGGNVKDGTTVELYRSQPNNLNAVWKMDPVNVTPPPNPKPTAPN